MRLPPRVTFASTAVLGLVAAVAFSHASRREQCIGAVLETPSGAGGKTRLRDELERSAPGGEWRVEPDPRGRVVTYQAGERTFTWLCTPGGVPLIEAISQEARVLTPRRIAPEAPGG